MAKREKANIGLTDREKEVLRLLADGFSNVETAEKLNVSRRTVESHRARIMLKTNKLGLPGLVKYAIKNNITQVNELRGESLA